MLKDIILFLPRILNDLINTLKLNDKGFSLKKLIAIVGLYCAVLVTIKHTAADNLIWVLDIWLLFVGLMAGLYSIGNIADAIATAKGEKSKSPDSNSTEEETPII